MGATSRASPTSSGRSDGSDRHDGGDGGMVTIEAAISLCAFISVLALVLATMSMVFDQLRCVDAAREAARLVARGEQNGAADAVHRIAPADSTYAITTDGDGIVVAVRDPDSLLPGVDLHADAYTVQEPTDDNEPTTTTPPAPDAVGQPDGPAAPSRSDPGPQSRDHGPTPGQSSSLAAIPGFSDGETPAVNAPPGSGSGLSAVSKPSGRNGTAADGVPRSAGGGGR